MQKVYPFFGGEVYMVRYIGPTEHKPSRWFVGLLSKQGRRRFIEYSHEVNISDAPLDALKRALPEDMSYEILPLGSNNINGHLFAVRVVHPELV